MAKELRVIAPIVPAGDFEVANAKDIKAGDKRLDVALAEAAAEVAKKANKTDVNNELNKKASTEYVNAELSKKADKADVAAELVTKANKIDTETALAGKASVEGLASANEAIADLSTEQAALSARMDTFTRLEEGSTTGDAELADGRVGADGKTYENIGGAIRGQVTDLKSDLSDLKSDIYNDFDAQCKNESYIKNTWVNGSYVSGVYKSQYKYLVCTLDMITPNKKISLLIDDGFRLRSLVFDDSGNFIQQSAWTTGSLDLNKGKHYQLIIGRDPSDESEIADIITFKHAIRYINYMFDNVVNNKDIPMPYQPIVDFIDSEVININAQYNAFIDNDTLIPSVFVRGSIDNTGKYIRDGYGHRISTVAPFISKKRLTYSVKEGYSVKILQYDGEVTLYEGGITGEFDIFPDTYYSVVISKVTEDITKEADIKEYASAVKLVEKTDILFVPCEFVNGSRDANGELTTTGYMRRISSKEMFRMEKRTTFRINNGYEVRITSFDDDGNKIKSQSGLTDYVTLGDDRQYHITISKVNDDSETDYTANITLFRRKVYRIMRENKNHLRIMIFGHSYSADSWQYVPFILKNYGITCEIYLYYRGNDSINRLVQEWTDTTERGTDNFDITHIRRFCHIDTRYCEKWDKGDGVSGYSAKMILEKAASEGDLDLITLQTAPTEVYFTRTPGGNDPRVGCEPYIRQAISLIRDSYQGHAVLGWFCSYTRILPYNGNTGYPPVSGDEFDNRIGALKAAETSCLNEPFDMVIPAAAAVFSARTNETLASTSYSDIGNLWYSDAVHLQQGIPCYIANLTVVQAIFKKFYPNLSVFGDPTVITDDWCTERNCIMPSIHGSVKNWNAAAKRIAQKIAVIANEHPFEIVPVYFPSSSKELDFYDTNPDRYWADGLIDTSNIDNGLFTEQSGDA